MSKLNVSNYVSKYMVILNRKLLPLDVSQLNAEKLKIIKTIKII